MAASRAGETIDGRPSHPSGVTDPGFAIRCDTGEERHLAEPTVGLRPIPATVLFETTQVKRVADSVYAIGIAGSVHAGQ